MCSKLSCYQLKIACYKYKLFHVSLMVITKQKSIVYTQKIKRKESKNTMTENHQIKKEGSKRRNKGTMKEPENNKMAMTTYRYL